MKMQDIILVVFTVIGFWLTGLAWLIDKRGNRIVERLDELEKKLDAIRSKQDES
jgi:hypothetical protein